LLLELLASYIAGHPYGVSLGHIHQLRTSLAAWQRFAGHCLSIGDLQDEPLNTYLDWMRQHRAPDTVRTRRGNLLILWHWAFQEGVIDLAPRRIRRLRPIPRQPRAWTVQEVVGLIRTAEGLPGCFHGTVRRRASWWSSLIRAGYDTGLRLGDLLALRTTEVGPLLSIVQHKTGRPVNLRLRPATLAAIDQTLADEARDIVWPLWGTQETFYGHVRALVTQAGIRPGTFRWLRRTACTQLERVEPGRGTELLGHASRSTTEMFYLDRSQLREPPLPPL
jgi:integrase